MSVRGNDFTLDVNKLEKEYQLVEVAEWVDFDTKKPIGFHYSVMLPKLRFEKLKVSIKSEYPIVTKEELEEKGSIIVKFDGLRTWASVYNGRLSAKAEATNVNKVSK